MTIRLLANLAGLAVLASLATAQLHFDELRKRHLPTGHDADSTATVVLGDVDGDFDPDLVLGNWGEQNRLYLNDGTGTFSDVTAVRLPIDNDKTAEIAIGDVDGDFDNDLVFANGEGQNRLYLNDGAGNFTDATAARLPAYPYRTRAIALGDVDGDGDLDLICGNGHPPSPTSQNRLYLNDGTGTFTDATATRLPAVLDSTAAIAFGDVDGDGDDDIVFGNYRGQNRLCLNDGSGVFTEATVSRMPIDADSTADLALGDVDGDGDLDLVCGTEGFLRPLTFNRLYLNDGAGVFTDATTPRLPSGHAAALVLGDADGDGDLDLVVGHSGVSTGGWINLPPRQMLYLNDGTGTFTDATATRMPSVQDFAGDVAFGDVDFDGDHDVVFANWQMNRLFSNDGAGTFTDATATGMPGDADHCWGMAVGDVDADGDPDVVIGNNLGQNRLYLNDGTGAFSDATAGRMPVDVNRTSAVAMGDVDGDGDLDLVFGNGNSDWGERNRLYLNDGSGTFTDVTTRRLPIDYNQTYAIALKDVDGDGDPDLVSGNSGGFATLGEQNRLYLNDGTGKFIEVTWTHMPTRIDRTHAVLLGDVDRDGDPDLILGNGRLYGRTGGEQNRLYLNDGTGTFTDATAGRMPIEEDRTSALAFGDVDWDGDLDLVCGNGSYGRAYQNRLYLNDGAGVFTDATAQRLPPDLVETSAVVLGDVDEDGDLDLIFGNGSLGVWRQNRFYVNDGTGHFTDATATRLPTDHDSTSAVALSDLDGDGDSDLIFGNYLQDRIYRNLRRQLTTPLQVIPGRVYRIEVYARDGAPNLGDVALPFVSAARARIPLPPFGTLGLDPTAMIPLPQIVIPGASGVGSLDVPIPNQSSLVGLSIHAQALLTRRRVVTNVVTDVVVR